MRISVIINNYNYDRYLAAAIDSALAQTYADTEVIVVDDGSTDGSRATIDGYGNRLARTIFQDNGGQGSTFNSGFTACTGDAVLFLDADDLLFPDAAATIADHADNTFSKLTWQMRVVGPDGKPSGLLEPTEPPEAGDIVKRLVTCGPYSFKITPGSGNAWSRRYLEQVLPMSASKYRRGADDYLLVLSPVYGPIIRIDRPLSCYRRHADNFLAAQSEFEKMATLKRRYTTTSGILANALAERGILFDRSMWRHRHWEMLEQLAQAVTEHVPQGEMIVLVDEDKLNVGTALFGRPRRYLMELNGGYNGLPADSAAAVRQIAIMQSEGAKYAVFTSSCLWWLDHYADLAAHLDANGKRVIAEPAVVIYRLTEDTSAHSENVFG